MKVRIKLISPLGRPPPGFDKFGAAAVDINRDATLADILARFQLTRQEPYMTLVNGESIVASERDRHVMGDGDEVTIFPPIQGG